MKNLGVADRVAIKVEENWGVISMCQKIFGGVYVWFDSRSNRINVNHEPDSTLFHVDIDENEIGSVEFEVVSRLSHMGVKGITDYYDFEDIFIESKKSKENKAA